MAARGRWRVEVLPLFTRDGAAPLPPPASPALHGPPPRLTELAVACDLSGVALDEELVNVRRHRSELAAYEAGLVERKAALGSAHHQQVLPGARTDVRADADGDPSLEAADDFLPDDVAALLGMSVPSARYLVEHDLVLVRQLPEVWHALADGRIDETRAAVIVRALRWQGASHGGPVDDDVLAGVASLGVGWAERGCPPSTLKKRLDAALIAAGPAAADRRAELRKRGADVRVTGTGDGLADLRAEQMDIADATLLRAQLDAYARRLKADGDERSLGALRIAVLINLVTRPWEKQEPVVAHLTVDADLADLGPLPDLTSIVPFGTPPDDDPPDDDPPDDDQPDVTSPDDYPPDSIQPEAVVTRPDLPDSSRSDGASGVGHVDGLPVGPAAVRALLQRIDALGLTDPDSGDLVFTIGEHGRLLAVATPDELVAAARAGVGVGPPPAVPRYRPSAAQYRYVRARDRHCRFPGCRQVARACDADHVAPYDHARPRAGGPTCTTNLVMLCRRHHRLKTHAPGWSFRLDPDGTLHVTTPGGTTRVTRPPALDQLLDLVDPLPPPHDPVADPPPF